MAAGGSLDEMGKAVASTLCWWISKGRCNWVFREEKSDAEKDGKGGEYAFY